MEQFIFPPKIVVSYLRKTYLVLFFKQNNKTRVVQVINDLKYIHHIDFL
jgi:hypothetical protein